MAILGVYDGNASAVAAAFDVRLSLACRFRGVIGLSCATERDRSVGAGVGGYTIPVVELGPVLGLERGRLRGELGLSARLGLLILQGKDMPSTHAAERLIPGMAAQLRLVGVGARFSPFATLIGSWWIGRRTLALDDNPATADLPGWDAQIGLGIFWGLGK